MTKENEGQEPVFPFVYGKDFEQSNAGEICSGINIRDYACIHLKVPKTGKPWLDELITDSLRNEMAGRAMQGNLSNHRIDQDSYYRNNLIPILSYELADAMLQSGKGENDQA